MQSFLRPRLQLTFVQHFDLVLYGIESLTAKPQQRRTPLVPGQHVVQRQLPRFDACHQLFQLLQSSFVTGRLGGHSNGGRSLGHSEGGKAQVKNQRF